VELISVGTQWRGTTAWQTTTRVKAYRLGDYFLPRRSYLLHWGCRAAVSNCLHSQPGNRRVPHFRLKNHVPQANLGTTTDMSRVAFVSRKSCLTVFLNHLQEITSENSSERARQADRLWCRGLARKCLRCDSPCLVRRPTGLYISSHGLARLALTP